METIIASFAQRFSGSVSCDKCMLSFQKAGINGETRPHCAALGNRPRCPDGDGERRQDCPLLIAECVIPSDGELRLEHKDE